MPRLLESFSVPELDAREWPRLCARLLDDGRPRLACAQLRGGTLALGRYQWEDTTLTARARRFGCVRRVTGGRLIGLGEGMLAVALTLPHRSWLVGEDPAALPVERLLNRAVRGALSGLARLGVAASYPGRDFVAVDGAQAGHLSFDVTESGAALVELILAAEAHWWAPESADDRPRPDRERPAPPPAALPALEGRSAEELRRAMASGYSERFGLDAHVVEPPAPGSAPPDLPDLPRRSPLIPVSLGWVEARVALDAEGRLSRVAFGGDFLADSGGHALACRALAGCAPLPAAIDERLQRVYGDPSHVLLGAEPEEVARAIAEAASGG